MNKNKLLLATVAMMMLLGNIGTAFAEPALVYFSPANATIVPGESMNISIVVNPAGNPISGMQTNIIFDPTKIRINYFASSNLFSAGGLYRTFPNQGALNNSSGRLINTFEAIIGRHNVISIGTYGIINITAIGPIGISNITFDNLKVSSPEGTPVAFLVTNGSVTVQASPTPTPTPTSTPALSCAKDIDEDGTMEYPDLNHDNLIDQTDLDYIQYAIDAGMTCAGDCAIDIDEDGIMEYPDQNHDNLIDQTDLDYIQYAIDAGMTC